MGPRSTWENMQTSLQGPTASCDLIIFRFLEHTALVPPGVFAFTVPLLGKFLPSSSHLANYPPRRLLNVTSSHTYPKPSSFPNSILSSLQLCFKTYVSFFPLELRFSIRGNFSPKGHLAKSRGIFQEWLLRGIWPRMLLNIL